MIDYRALQNEGWKIRAQHFYLDDNDNFITKEKVCFEDFVDDHQVLDIQFSQNPYGSHLVVIYTI